MPKDQYYKRFESLFSSPEAVAAEPPTGKTTDKVADKVAEAGIAALQARVAELEMALTAANSVRLKAERDIPGDKTGETQRQARVGQLETAPAADKLAPLQARVGELEDALASAQAARIKADQDLYLARNALAVAPSGEKLAETAALAAQLQARLVEAETALAEANAARRQAEQELENTLAALDQAPAAGVPAALLGYTYDPNGVRRLAEGEPAANGNGHGQTLENPLILRGETIGRLAVTDAAAGADSAAIIAAVADRLGAHLETLGLRAARVPPAPPPDLDLDLIKTSLLTNVSHELRTPLNSILGFTQVMIEAVDGDANPAMVNDLKVVRKNGRQLLNTINDILDMAKINGGKLALSPEIFDLKEVIDEVIATATPLAVEKALALSVDAGPTARLDIYADRSRVRQVLLKLLDNAIKFTDAGRVELSAVRDGAAIRVAVRDTGPGIAPANLDRIFEEFTQIDASTTRKNSGIGLGLAISRAVVQLHGGRLWAESDGRPGPRGGSAFIVELPVETTYIQ